MASVYHLRTQNKKTFGNYLQLLCKLPEFDALLNSKQHKLSPFRLEQINETHYIESLNILCYQFSCNGSVILDKILMSSVIDQESFRSIQLKHAIKTGLGIVVKDKYDNIAASVFVFDHCDNPKYDTNKFTQNTKKRTDIIDEALKRNEEREQLIENNIKYGEIINFSAGATRPDVVKSGLNNATTMALFTILLCMNYKYWIHTVVSPYIASTFLKTMKIFKNWHLSYSVYNYYHSVLKELNDLSNKYQISKKQINDLRKNAQIHIFIDNYKLLTNQLQYNGIKQWYSFVVDVWTYRARHKL